MVWLVVLATPVLSAFFQPVAVPRIGERGPQVGQPVVIPTPLRPVPFPGQSLHVSGVAGGTGNVAWAWLAFAAGAAGAAALGAARPVAQLGLFDGLSKAFENDSSLGERKQPGLKGPKARAVTVNVCGKPVQAIPGQRMAEIVRRNTREIKFDCTDGVCGTCECLVNGRKARVCQMKVPNKDVKVTPKKSYAGARF